MFDLKEGNHETMVEKQLSQIQNLIALDLGDEIFKSNYRTLLCKTIPIF